MNMFNNLLALIKCILDFILFFWFSMLFFDRRWENRNFPAFTVLIILALLLNAVNLLHMPLLNILVTFSSALIINFPLYTGPVKQRIVCMAAQVLLPVVCEFIPSFAYSMIHHTRITAAGSETIRNAGLNIISTCILSVIILGMRHVIILREQKENDGIIMPENLSILAVPLVSILTVYHIFSFEAANPSASLQSSLQNLILFLGILCMNIVVITGDNHSRKHHQLQREYDRLNRLEQLNHVVIQQQDQYIQEMKGVAHDYTRRLEGIKQMIGTGEAYVSNDIRHYADEMLRHIEESCRFVFTAPTPIHPKKIKRLRP